MNKILGIAGLFLVIFLFTMSMSHDFLSANNLQNFLRWTAIFSLMSIGVAFVIMTGGIDLSIGSVVALSACMLSMLMVQTHYEPRPARYIATQIDIEKKAIELEGYLAEDGVKAGDRLIFAGNDRQERYLTIQSISAQLESAVVVTVESPKRVGAQTALGWHKHTPTWSFGAAVVVILAMSAGLGLVHGLLITKLQIQPFVVTLCSFLVYRGLARYIALDKPMGFKDRYDSIKHWAQGTTGSIPVPFINYISDGQWSLYKVGRDGKQILENGQPVPVDLIEWVQIPNPLIVMVIVALIAAIFLNRTVFGRYLLALGANEQATRFSGIKTDRIKIMAYVICSALAGLAGMFLALDLGTISPSNLGNMYELYAIAGAVLGGCSLRGGEGNIIGVIIGAAVMRLIYNSINLLGIPSMLEYVVIGCVILGGVMADELSRKLAAYRRARQQAAVASKT
jgi:ribose transport system permease protein